VFAVIQPSRQQVESDSTNDSALRIVQKSSARLLSP
jgi:hypothetical protein